MPARYQLTREYELEMAEEILAQAYAARIDPGFRRFRSEVFAPRLLGECDEFLVQLWDASEHGRLCARREARAALGLLAGRLGAVESPLGFASAASGERQLQLGLIRLAELRDDWVRPAADWRPEGAEPPTIRRSGAAPAGALAPAALYGRSAAEPAGDGRAGWFVQVARGGSLRSAPGLPVRLTRRMTHLAMETEGESCFARAIRRGQVLGTGGSDALAHAVGLSWLGRDLAGPAEEAWWDSVFRWMAGRRDLDPVLVGPLLDYLRHLKRRDPGFAMKDRTLRPLVAGMEGWHRELRRRRRRRNRQKVAAPPPGFSASRLRAGLWRFGSGQNRMLWHMDEILSSARLREEGSEQGHCVGSYEGAVRSGSISIWSLWIERASGNQHRALTLEVDNQARRIIQARGRFNRWPEEEAMRILRLWALENALTLAIEHG